MKKSLTIIYLMAGAVASHAQGMINLNSYVPQKWSITIYSENYSNPSAGQISGNSIPWDFPVGTTPYPNETPLGGTVQGTGPGPSGEYNGDNYTVGFYLATSLSALNIAVTSGSPNYTTLMDTMCGIGNSGIYDFYSTNINYVDPTAPSGSAEYVAIAAWYSGSGFGSYASARAAGLPSGYVNSTSTVSLGSAPSNSPNLAGTGLTSFDLTVVPEPNTEMLGALGLGLLFRQPKDFFRRLLISKTQ